MFNDKMTQMMQQAKNYTTSQQINKKYKRCG